MLFFKKLSHSFELIIQKFTKRSSPVLSAKHAYEMWADSYDQELKNGNLMVFYNDLLVDYYFANLDARGMIVCDFGAGTGRHRAKLMERKPKRWIGCDTSAAMLDKLRLIDSQAEVYELENHTMPFLKDNELDLLFSSLTIGHIKDIGATLKEWNRTLKPGGKIFITMVHPILAKYKEVRSFKDSLGRVRIIENYRHEPETLKRIFSDMGWVIKTTKEVSIDERAYSTLKEIGKLHLYERSKKEPMILEYQLEKVY